MTPGNTLPVEFVKGLNTFVTNGNYSAGIRSTDDPSVYNIQPKLWKYGGDLPKKRKKGRDYRLCLEAIVLGMFQCFSMFFNVFSMSFID